MLTSLDQPTDQLFAVTDMQMDNDNKFLFPTTARNKDDNSNDDEFFLKDKIIPTDLSTIPERRHKDTEMLSTRELEKFAKTLPAHLRYDLDNTQMVK